MQRPRIALALLALLLLAGCSAPGSVSLDPADDAELIDQTTRGLPDRDAERVGEPLHAAVQNGSGTVTDVRDAPFDTDRPVVHDGAVYRLNYTVVDERTVPRFDVAVDYNPDAEAVSSEPVAFESLSAPDREALSGLLTPGEGPHDDGPDVHGTAVYEEPSTSALVGTETAVSYDGETYLVTVERDGSATFEDYRYTATRVGSVEAYATRLRASHEFTLGGLPPAQASVLKEARNGSYYADGSDDEAFAGVLKRFRAHEAVREDEYVGEWIVRWRGETYWATLRYSEYRRE